MRYNNESASQKTIPVCVSVENELKSPENTIVGRRGEP